MKIQKLYDDIKTILPKEYHYPIKICSSYPEMVKILVKKDKIRKNYRKVADEFAKEIKVDKDYNKYSKYTEEIERKYPRRRMHRYSRPILGFAGDPILLNRGVLNKESKYFIAMVILHEIGHNAGYISEGGADKFALEWMAKVEPILERNSYE